MTAPPLIQTSRLLIRPLWQKYSDSLRAHMERERITPDDLAIVLGVSAATARNRWAGRSVWRIDELIAVAEVTDRPLSHLLLDAEIAA